MCLLKSSLFTLMPVLQEAVLFSHCGNYPENDGPRSDKVAQTVQLNSDIVAQFYRSPSFAHMELDI